MRLTSTDDGGRVDLTYCTNIHPGESWADVRAALGRYLPKIKASFSLEDSFGVGLRLSDRAARELEAPDAFAEFSAFLRDTGLYVFTINGFPYRDFHHQRVKDAVYLPDWRDPRRLDYSDRLARLLSRLLPEDMEGSVSTVPGGYKRHLAQDPSATALIAEHLLRHVATLHRLHAETGRSVTLALEPEPSCLLETIDETVMFFEERLLSAAAVADVGQLCQLNMEQAETTIRRHLGVCLDTCHAAVEFEDPDDVIQRLRHAGIRIAKLQLSAGLRVPDVAAMPSAAFDPFAEEVYLHQVVERSPRGLRRIDDLSDALADSGTALEAGQEPREWRIHFHVPIWSTELGLFGTTRDFLERILSLHRDRPIAPHLEVETYTWSVLPEAYRAEPLAVAITRELQWVKEQLS